MRNLKRALSLGLTAAMISGLMVMGSSAASSSYTDVAATDNVEAIEVLKAVGIMVGDENGDFNPDALVTRNEMAVIMSNLMAYNVATYRDTSPFTDVPSWAEPYVAACYTNGITAGTSATTYGGSDSVTTAQAALMVMKALGYFQYSSDFGGDWQLATVSQGNKIDLFIDVDSSVREAMTRNDVAQLVLNALEAGTVEADAGTSIVVGDITITSDVKYNYITSGEKYADSIDSDLKASTDATVTSGKIVQLGEKLYLGDLTKTEGTDDFGRPADIWEYQADEIGTFAKSADYTFTSKVTSKALYNAIGKTAAEYKDWDVSINGESVAYTGSDLMSNKSDDDQCFLKYEGVELPHSTDAYTGNGVVTQVYVDGTNRTVDIAVINYYSAEVLDVDEDDGTITLSSFYGPATTRDEFEVTGFEEDDIVVYAFSNLSEEIEEVYAAQEMSGEVTRVRTNNEKSEGDYFVADGTTYNYNTTMDGKDRLLAENVNNNVVAYLDANGYVVYIDEAAMTYDYAYVLSMGTESDQYGNNTKATVYARLVLTDGTIVRVETDEDDATTLLNHIVSYSVDKNGVYSLDDRTGGANIYGPDNAKSTADSAKASYGTGLKIENGKAAMKVDGSSTTANANTVFIVVSTDSRYANYDITVYTGIKNVPDIDGDSATQAIVAKDRSNSAVAKVVYIEDADVSGSESVIFARADGAAKFVKDSDIGDYYEINAVVDGATTTLMVKATATNAVDTLVTGAKHVVALKSITVNDDGLVTNVKAYETKDVDADTYYVNVTGTLAEEKDTVGIGLAGDDAAYYAYSDDVVVARYNYKNAFEVSRISSIKNDANDGVVAVLDENVLIGICILEETGGENENKTGYVKPEEPVNPDVSYGVHYWASSNKGTMCFAFWESEDETAMTVRELRDLGLTASDFTITVNNQKFVGQEIVEYGTQKLSDSKTTAYIKISFGDVNEVFMDGDKYSTNTTNAADNNIKFSAEIDRVTVDGYEGTIDIQTANA